MILGTVKEVTIGPTSLMAIVTSQFTRELSPDFVVLLTFLTGVMQFLMGVLRLGRWILILISLSLIFIKMPVIKKFDSLRQHKQG